MKKWKAAITVVVLTLSVAFILGGCSKQKENLSRQEDKKVQIGVSFDSLVIERWIRDRDTFTKYAKQMGAEVNVQSANGDSKTQIKQIEYFISQKVDVIVIVPVDCYALADVVKEAKKEGIKVVAYDRPIEDGNADLYISFDNRQVGELMAQTFIDTIPEGGKIVEISGSDTDVNVKLVEEGFEEKIKEGNLQVVYKAYCKNWEADQATAYMEEALEQNSDIAGVKCGNDDVATRVCQVLAEHRMAGKVVVVGQDADLAACQRIVEGTQNMTVFKQCEKLAEYAAKFAVQLAKGEDITDAGAGNGEYAKETISDGTNEIPYYKLETTAVTKGNMDEVIIDSGFHDASDVYLNVVED